MYEIFEKYKMVLEKGAENFGMSRFVSEQIVTSSKLVCITLGKVQIKNKYKHYVLIYSDIFSIKTHCICRSSI